MNAAGTLLAAWLLSAAARPQAAAPPALPDDHAARMQSGLELYDSAVRALLEARCLRCHGGEATRGDLDLAEREGLLAGGKGGPAVVPFDPAASRLLRLVRHEEKPHMPRNEAKLDAAEIGALERWIELGAPYSRALAADADAAKRPLEVTEADRAFWSLRPLVRPPLPAVRDEARCRNPIDRFVQARLEESGVAPAAPAPRAELLRRAWFDLVGLPPPPEVIDAFVADARPDAWERAVDSLLADPAFGERFARHWLDVARFAESHGFEHDTDRPHAWPYRDFVIEAFARDLPFDEFVRWQIAGDEIAPDEPLAWFATGFLGAGVHATQITENQVEKERYDELDDVVATIGTAMLGLTIGCARCHDHKFDPIPTRDYYRMVATFTRTVRSDHDVPLDPRGDRERLAAWEARRAELAAELSRFEREEGARAFDERLARPADPAAQAGAAREWLRLDPAALTSAGGATFAAQDNGSWLAGGENAPRDVFEFVARIPGGALDSVASVRVEALADPSLAHGGPGRAGNGNFGLTELVATWQPDAAGAEPGAREELRFASARATFDQAGLPASAAIDGVLADDAPCWAVDPQFGRGHAAAFDLAAPLATAAGGELRLALHFRTNVHHGIGRLRICVAERGDGPGPPLDAAPLPAADLRARFLARDPGWRARRDALDSHLAARPQPRTQKALVCSEGLPAIRLHTQGGDFLEATHFLVRGDPARKEGVVEPGFLQVLTREGAHESRWRGPAGEESRTSGDRRALADWITDVEHGAGALLSRVAVNRCWQHLFGRGIVATPSDFGRTGAPPTHPELLEWLACDFVEGGFRVKPILRQLLASATYLQGAGSGAQAAADPEGELFARQPPRRLEAEAIRDAMLATSGLLDCRRGGPSALDPSEPRRSIYLFVKRSRLVPMLARFDAPNALSGLGRRVPTTVAPQSLLLMNAPEVRAWAEAFARRVLSETQDGTDADRVRRAFRLAFARAPTEPELADALAFLAEPAAAAPANGGENAPEAALSDLCHALFCANEFVYVD